MAPWSVVTAAIVGAVIIVLFLVFAIFRLIIKIKQFKFSRQKRDDTEENLIESPEDETEDERTNDKEADKKDKEADKKDKEADKKDGKEATSVEEKGKGEEKKKNPRIGAMKRIRAMFSLQDKAETRKRLVNHLKDLDINENFGVWHRRLLHFAVEIGQTENLDLLFELKGDEIEVDARTKIGKTPAYVAAEKNKVIILDYLINRGADITVKDNDEDSIVVGAVKHNASEVVKYLFDKHKDAAKAMIDTPNLDGETALYWAVRQESSDIVDLLLENGASLITPNTTERFSPLHHAVLNGNLQTVRVLFEHFPVKWGTKDSKGNRPLHIAAMNDNDDVVKYLYEKNDILVANKNADGMTALDTAEYYNSSKAINILSSVDVFDAVSGEPQNKFPTLCFLKACKDGKSDTVARLLREKEGDRKDFKIFRQVDSDFNNCLDLALDNGHIDVAQMILRDDEWKDALCNDNRWDEERNKSGDYDTPMRKLIRICPKLAEEVLDKCCTIRKGASDALKIDFEVDLDYRFIEDADLNLNEIDLSPSSRVGPGIFRDLFDSDHHKRYTDDEVLLRKNDPLSHMIEYNREDLLKHPLTTRMIEQRWKLIRFPFLVSSLLYVTLAVCVTGLIAGLKKSHYLDAAASNASCGETCDLIRGDAALLESFERPDAATFPLQVIIFVVAVSLFTLELLGVVADGSKYLKIENLIDHFVLISSVILVLQMTDCPGFRCQWQWHLASLTVFFAWMAVVIEFQVFANFGVFTLMFIHIIKTFASIFLLLAPFIIGFSYAFYAILNQTAVLQKFYNESSFYTLMKVGVMTVGEINADDFFDALVEGEVKGRSHRLVSVFFFVLFIIMMPVIIMNLLIGLAVGDIGEIRSIAELQKIKYRIETIQGVQYSNRNQMLIKRISGFLFRHVISEPSSWKQASIRANRTFMNKLRIRLGFRIDPSKAKELKKGIVTEDEVSVDAKINDLEVSIKNELKGIVKESDLANIKDEIIERILAKLDQH